MRLPKRQTVTGHKNVYGERILRHLARTIHGFSFHFSVSNDLRHFNAVVASSLTLLSHAHKSNTVLFFCVSRILWNAFERPVAPWREWNGQREKKSNARNRNATTTIYQTCKKYKSLFPVLFGNRTRSLEWKRRQRGKKRARRSILFFVVIFHYCPR